MSFSLINPTNSEQAWMLTLHVQALVGRSAKAEIRLEGNGVSRKHAELLFDENGVWVTDLNSRYGTRVNGERIRDRVQLSPGDRLAFGPQELVLQRSAAEGGEILRPEDWPMDSDATPSQASPEPLAENDPSPVAAGTPLIETDSTLANADYYTDRAMQAKRKIHEAVLLKLNLPEIATKDIEQEALQRSLREALDEVLLEKNHELPAALVSDEFRQSMLDELLAFGPIMPMLREGDVDEVMVNGPDRIFVERKGRLYETKARFLNDQHLIRVIQRIVEPVNRHIDESSPMVDARLPDGSRVNAIIPPLAIDGPSLTIRKFGVGKLTTDDLIANDSMSPAMALFLEEAVRSHMNILVSGGTGSGKTTLLNVLSQFIEGSERVVTIEDSAELQLDHPNLVRLEARPANIEGEGHISIRDLLVNSLRMRPDRIIVGECRGAEALDMLQAMNTGHDGSLTTIHANSPVDSLSRLETLVLMAGYELPSKAIQNQIAAAVDLIVQTQRLMDGSRKIIQVTEVTGREEGIITTMDIFKFEQSGVNLEGMIEGTIRPSGNIPSFISRLREKGDLRLDMNVFVPTE